MAGEPAILALTNEAFQRRQKIASPPLKTAEIAVRIGFAPDAGAAFHRLAPKAQAGLRAKLKAFGLNPSLGKPLVGQLQGYHRVTYGRVRSIAKAVEAEAIVRVAAGVVIVHVLWLGLRKQGASDDPYEVAAVKALRQGDPDARQLLEALVRRTLQNPALVDEDD